MDANHSILAALQSDAPVPSSDVRRWIADARDLETLGLLYRLTYEAWARIEPSLDAEETCGLIRTYLLRCIDENPHTDSTMTRFEAASQLEVWFDHLADMMGDESPILRESAEVITDAYLRGNGDVRTTIEQVFLDHVLEQSRFRPLFAHWADHQELRDAWAAGIQWADAHPNFMKGLRQDS